MGHKRGQRKPMSEINMVPFIDIMMVMLVAFMVSSPMFTQGIQVDLPKTDSKPVSMPQGEEPLIISIKADGSYYLNLDSTDEKPLPLADIADKVGKIKQAKPSTMVLIQGDKAATYGIVVEAMGVLQNAGVSDVGLITQPGEQNAR